MNSTIASFLLGVGCTIAAMLFAPAIVQFQSPPETIQHMKWKPAYCAAFGSRDNVPLAVCSDVFYPVYDTVPEGYRGYLKECVIGGGIHNCVPAKL